MPPQKTVDQSPKEKKGSTNQRPSVIRLLICFLYSMLQAWAWVADFFTQSLDINIAQLNHYIEKRYRCAPGLHLFLLANARNRIHFRTQFPTFFSLDLLTHAAEYISICFSPFDLLTHATECISEYISQVYIFRLISLHTQPTNRLNI